ncbi:AI-2E family transporter [Sporolactobacillus nakayamae]|uniref:Predicted PurR-regulated permease PerM n=1 Tax=Sporolactobacillus nakayamae TaxID=269670 RepID=A0A1I2MS33_9BACL|nr:AI-2E family transporter [Sporolactobacillus nakayamae]SFF94324.1 Predicted PurR-regulated permease PerM [Sporolactobacillus nakayamae]
MPKSKYFRFAVWVLLILVILMVGSKLTFVLRPVGVLFTSLAAPLVISGLLYYLLRPLVRGLMRLKIPKIVAILIIYLVCVGLITLLAFNVGPLLYSQFLSLINSMPGLVQQLSEQLINFQQSEIFSKMHLDEIPYLDFANRFSKSLSTMATSIGNNVLSIIQSITGTVLIIATVPFILFYLLKDSDRISHGMTKLIPVVHQEKAREILKDMDQTLSGYIQGQMIVLLFDFIFIYIWYLIIGLNYSLVLALVILFTNVIPFIGSFIATIPAVIVAFIQSPILAVYVIVGVTVVQQIEGNVVSPLVMGRKLDIHPLTIICLLLVAGNLAGIIGMLFAIPMYAVCKVVVTRVYKLIQLRKQ